MPISSKKLTASFKDFFRKIKLKIHFRNENTNNHQFNIKWWLPGTSSFEPTLEELPRAAADAISHLEQEARKIAATPPPTKKQKRNISSKQLKLLSHLRDNDQIVIKAADKNLGITILDKQWYIKEAETQLADKNTYKEVTANEIPIAKIIKQLQLLSAKFLKSKIFTAQQHAFALSCADNDYRVPLFYLMPKLHKPKLCGRPITSCVNWILTPLSQLLDDILQPFMKRIPAFISDSADLLRTLQETEVPHTSLLITADVESLYPSIPTPQGIDIVLEFIYTHHYFTSLKKPPRDLLREALLLVLTNNFCQFGTRFFLQIAGTAMGTAVAVAYATLFMAAIEDHLFTTEPNIKLLKRFIDDYFILWGNNNKQEALSFIHDRLNNMHSSIKITYSLSNVSVDFLDLTIYKGPNMLVNNRLDTKIYQKPFNKFLYLPFNSYHTREQKTAFIKGLLIAYIRANSTKAGYTDVRNKFYFRLRNRGYPSEFLSPLFKAFTWTPEMRATLLEQKLPLQAKEQLPLTFKIENNQRIEELQIRKFLQKCETTLAEWNLPRTVLARRKPAHMTKQLITAKLNN